jgi:hypothetical protein
VRARAAVLLLAAAAAARCASAPSASGPAAAPAVPGKTPFSVPPAAAHEIRIVIDTRPGREILGALSRQKFESADVKVLEDMLPIELTIKDSGRPADVFERDFAAAWDPENRSAVFDFATIRNEKERWEALLEAVASGKEELEKSSASRAAALLPGDRAIQTRLAVYISFGLSGLADHLVAATPDGTPVVIVDLARALGEGDTGPATNQIPRLVRLISGEAYRLAWSTYREGSDAWKRPDPELGPIDPLVQMVAQSGPVAIFSLEESFFPLSTWLKEPMHRSLNDLNRMAERLTEAEADLDTRVALAAEIKRPEFMRRVAAPAGAYMEDGIIQTFGVDVLRGALASGPAAFFREYDRATRQNKDLPPLSKEIVSRLGGGGP